MDYINRGGGKSTDVFDTRSNFTETKYLTFFFQFEIVHLSNMTATCWYTE
jgi:hypothetical protein